MRTYAHGGRPRALRALATALVLLAGPARAAAEGDAAAAPPAPAWGYEEPWKLTLGLYRTADESSIDLNLRRSLGAFDLWLGTYHENAGNSVLRVGADWSYRSEWLRVTPAFAYATNGFFGGQVYAEIGRRSFLVAGYSQTNEKDYFNLTFDPNESVQLGAGTQIDTRDRLTASTTFDVRLGTGQQNSHLVYRRFTSPEHRLTVDLSYKSGHADDGTYVRGGGAQVTYDWPRFFARAAWDQYVNFTEQTMLRLGGGLRF